MLKKTLEWLGKETLEFKYNEHNNIKYPAPETIVSLHDFYLKAFSDKEEIHPGRYDTVDLNFSDIKTYFKEKDTLQDTAIHIGAKIFNRFLEAGHPFVDGNKRTGFGTLWIFLLMNGVKLKSFYQYQKHFDKIAYWAGIKKNSKNVEEITKWIYDNLEK